MTPLGKLVLGVALAWVAWSIAVVVCIATGAV